MTDDTKPVPEPGEAQRDEDEIHYFETDETNVGKGAESGAEGSGPAHDREQPGTAAAE